MQAFFKNFFRKAPWLTEKTKRLFRAEGEFDIMDREDRYDELLFVKTAHGEYIIVFEQKNKDIIEEKLEKQD